MGKSFLVLFFKKELLFLFALQAALFAAILTATLTLYPAWDMFSWLARWRQLQHDGNWPLYLWASHNEHHLPVIRLLIACDAAWFAGRGAVPAAAATAALLATAAMAYHATRPASRQPGLPWIAPMLVLTTSAAVDASSPINCVFPIAVFFSLAAILLLERSNGDTRGMALAAAAALLATWSSAWGFAAWPALAWLAWRRPANAARMAGLSAVLLIYVGAYFLPLKASAAHLSHIDWRAAAHFLLAFAGLPLSRAHQFGAAGQWAGAAMLAAGFISLLPRAEGHTTRRLAQALIVAGLAGAAFVTLGRASLEAPDRLPVRYAILLLPLQLGLFLIVVPWLRPRAGVALALLLLIAQVASAPPALRIASARRDMLARFYRGERDPGMRSVVFPDLGAAEGILGEKK